MADRGPLTADDLTPIYDLPQAEPRPDEVPGVMEAMCGDCAFRPGSPERTDDPTVSVGSEQLEQLVTGGTPFWCHNGMRRRVGSSVDLGDGRTVSVHEDDPSAFDPPMLTGSPLGPIPYKADGSPADLCAGWTARRLHHIYKADPETSTTEVDA